MEMAYRFAPADGPVREFVVELDPDTLAYRGGPTGPAPEWTRLEYKKCRNCPLKPAQNPHCPIAVNIAPLVEAFKDSISYTEADIEVRTPERTYQHRAPMQAGVSSLFGVVMTTSGCPILDKLRPMVFTHLPLANLRETMFRSMSAYLLGQFVTASRGKRPDWTLKGLSKLYTEVSKVNADFSQRLRSLVARDASINAVVKLDCFAAFTVNAIDKKKLGWLDALFPGAEPRK